MTLRIGVNARTFTESEPGGAVQVAKKTTRALTERADTEIVLFGHESVNAEFPDLRVIDSGYVHTSQGFGVLWERTILPRLAKRANIDVLFCPNGNGPLTEQPYPVVTCIHDVNAIQGFTSGIHRAYRKTTIPRVVNVSDHIVTVSEFSKSELVTTLDVDPEKVSVVYNGVDDIYHADGNGRPIDVPDSYVLYVGSMNPRKNVAGAIEAFQRFADDAEDDYRFVLVGPGNKSIFDDLEIPEDDRIVTPGFLSQTELKYAYSNAEVFLYPSLYEGFGLPPLEAMACGTPVVVSDAAALPEVIGDAGEYVDPNDTEDIVRGLKRVLGGENQYDELVAAGKDRASEFTWTEAGKALMTVLQEK